MEQLKISREVSLPLDAVTQTLAAIARKGAGKTFLASLIAEQMLDARVQVIVVDPVGNWWGLRVALAFNTTVRARGFEENVRTLRSYELVERTDDGLKAADWLYQVDGRASR